MSSVGSGDEEESERGNVEVIEDEDDEEEPTEEEIVAYAEYLGIDPDAEPDLMWIARKGVGAPVPKPWKACKEGDEVFYYNFDTQESMWDHPCDAQFRSLVEEHRKAGPGGPPSKSGRDSSDAGSEVSEEVSEDIPSATSTPASTPAGASGGQGRCLEKGEVAAGGPVATSTADDAAGSDAAPGAVVGATGSPSAAATSPAGAVVTSPAGGAGDQDPANESQSFLSEAVDSEDLEEQQAGAADLASPSGPPPVKNSPVNDDSKSSFVSDLVDESDLAAVEADSGLATSPTGADVAKETDAKQPESASLTKESVKQAAESSPKPSSPTVAQLSMKDAAALWSAGAGGMAMSTPRSPASSRSQSSSPRGGVPCSASSSASVADTPASPAAAAAGSETKAVEQPSDATAAAAPQEQDTGKPAVDRISTDPLDARVSQKSPQGSPLSGDRPPPVLDNATCGISARSSNPSEVSEDFRSDWGVMSPPITARSGSGGAALAEGQSLEVSMSVDGRSMDTEGPGRSAGSLSRSPPDVRSPSLASTPMPKRSARTWTQLHREMQVLSKALESCSIIRSKQREYLELLNIDSLKRS